MQKLMCDDPARSFVRPSVGVRQLWPLRCLAIFAGMSVCCVVTPANSAEPASERWAILAAPEVANSGLSDLLAVELSKSIDLVEREALQDVLREIEVSQVGAADGVTPNVYV